MKALAPYKKSIGAFLGTLGFLIGSAMTDGVLTGSEIMVAVGGTLTTTLIVWGVRNKPAPDTAA